MTFGLFLRFFGHFTTLRARISGKHCPKVKIFAKFEFSVSDLPKKLKIVPKRLFWPIFIFYCHFCHFWQSDTWFRFRNSTQQHQFGLNGVSLDRAHVCVHFGDRTAYRFQCSEIPGQLKVQNCHFLAVFRPWPHLDTSPRTIKIYFYKPSMGPYLLAKFHYSSFMLIRSKTAVTECASHEQIHYLDLFFWTVFWWNWVRIEVKNNL